MITKEYFQQWRAKHPESNAQARKRYRANNIERARGSSRKWNHDNRPKLRAHAAVFRAIKKGILKRLPCFVCQSPNVQAHHNDYSQPLAVVWVCNLHHKQLYHRQKQFGA